MTATQSKNENLLSQAGEGKRECVLIANRLAALPAPSLPADETGTAHQGLQVGFCLQGHQEGKRKWQVVRGTHRGPFG